nr:M24 family metallopeptidase [Fictibacillus sp. WQ 8-8]
MNHGICKLKKSPGLSRPFSKHCFVIYGNNFGHSLGHSLGLVIHEKPAMRSTDDTVLQEGMVITVEPGIYIPGFGGVRIEDLVVITKHGHENLTKSTKDLQNIPSLMGV